MNLHAEQHWITLQSLAAPTSHAGKPADIGYALRKQHLRLSPVTNVRNPLIYLIFITLPCHAVALENWGWSGFASVGAGKTNRDGMNFMNYDDHWSFDADSVVGLHFQGDLLPHLSFTGQLVAQGFHANDTDDYQPEVDWLFLGYQWTPTLRMRVGRMRTPHYLYSESVNTGYSYPWARPPSNVYTFFLTPFYNFDGIDFTWNGDLGHLELDIQVFAGVMDGEYDELEIQAEPVGGANLTLRGEQWLLRYGLIVNDTDIHSPGWQPYQAAFQQLASLTGDAVFEEAAGAFEAENEPYAYHALAGQWEEGNWTLIAEGYHISNRGDGFANTSKGWYTSIVYHIGNWSPYVTTGSYDNILNEDAIAALESSYATYPAGSLGLPAELLRTGTIEAFKSFRSKQRTWTVGTRYDVLPNTCIKAEVEYFDFQAGTTGLMIPSPGAKRPGDALLVSFVIDVVF